MKKTVLIIIMIIAFIFPVTAADDITPQDILDTQIEALNPELFDSYLKNQEGLLIKDSSAKNLISNILEGRALDTDGILKRFYTVILDTITKTIRLGAVLLAILLVCAIINAMSPQENGTMGKTAQAVCTMAATMVIIGAFSSYSKDVMNALKIGSNLIRAMLPVMVVLLAAAGKVVSAGSVSALLIFSIAGLNELITGIFSPLLYGFLALGSAGCAFTMQGMEKMAKAIKSLLVWGIGLAFTLFSVVLTIQGASLGVADRVAGKTIKFALGSFIPVIGKIVSDSADMVFTCAGSVHSAFGILGIIICLSYALIPALGLIANIIMCKLLSSMSSMMGNTYASKLLSVFSDGFSLLLAVLAMSSVLFIVAFAFIAVRG